MEEDEKTKKEEYSSLDTTLRPHTWGEYVGQQDIKRNLSILIHAALERDERPEHILLYGPPGLGKTTLAHLVAKESKGSLVRTSGPAITKAGEVAALLTNLSHGDILFIDEIHRLNKTVEEILYPAMETGSLDVMVGKGPSARTVRVDIQPFTLVAATTRISLLSSPLRSRFSGGTFRLQYYTTDEIASILKRSATLLGVKVERDILKEIAGRSRNTPRTGNYLLKRCRDFAQIKRIPLKRDTVNDALTLLNIDSLGLTELDRALLKTLYEKFNGGPVGIETLALSLSEETATIEEVNEPFLIQQGFLERTPRGRVITKHGIENIQQW